MEYHPKVINFFKKHNLYDEETINYLKENTMLIEYDYPDERAIIGCFYILDQNNILRKIKVNIPYSNNEKMILINIHELVHGIENYKKIGQVFQKDLTIETLPLLYEKLYILENQSKELIAYSKYLDNLIETNSEKEYKFGLSIRDELLENYSYNMQDMQKLAKKLVRKYK